MSWEEAVVLRPMANSAVAAIAGQNIEWDERAPDAPLPAIMLQTITNAQPQNNDGFDPFWPTRVQVNCLAPDKKTAVALRKAVIPVLVAAGEQDGVIFVQSFVDGGGSDAERTPTGRICRERTDLIIWHN